MGVHPSKRSGPDDAGKTFRFNTRPRPGGTYTGAKVRGCQRATAWLRARCTASQRLASLEQLGALGGERGHLLGQHVALALERVHGAAQRGWPRPWPTSSSPASRSSSERLSASACLRLGDLRPRAPCAPGRRPAGLTRLLQATAAPRRARPPARRARARGRASSFTRPSISVASRRASSMRRRASSVAFSDWRRAASRSCVSERLSVFTLVSSACRAAMRSTARTPASATRGRQGLGARVLAHRLEALLEPLAAGLACPAPRGALAGVCTSTSGSGASTRATGGLGRVFRAAVQGLGGGGAGRAGALDAGTHLGGQVMRAAGAWVTSIGSEARACSGACTGSEAARLRAAREPGPARARAPHRERRRSTTPVNAAQAQARLGAGHVLFEGLLHGRA